jgi:hypothetical protein
MDGGEYLCPACERRAIDKANQVGGGTTFLHNIDEPSFA